MSYQKKDASWKFYLNIVAEDTLQRETGSL